MGVYRKDYIVFGWELPYEMKYEVNNEDIDFDSDDFVPYIEGHEGAKYVLISDYMSGGYRVFGILVAKDDGDGYNSEGWRFVELKDTSPDRKALIAEYVRLFAPVNPPSEPKLFIFSHFS